MKPQFLIILDLSNTSIIPVKLFCSSMGSYSFGYSHNISQWHNSWASQSIDSALFCWWQNIITCHSNSCWKKTKIKTQRQNWKYCGLLNMLSLLRHILLSYLTDGINTQTILTFSLSSEEYTLPITKKGHSL